MTQPHLVCVLNNDHLMELLEATLPDGPGYGRRAIDDTATVADHHERPIIAAGKPGPRYGLLFSALAETAMTLSVMLWDGLEQEPSSSTVLWGSRHGIISMHNTPLETTTLELTSGGTLYEQVFDATNLGPRSPVSDTVQVPVKPRLLTNIAPGMDETQRRKAHDELTRLTAQALPEISAHLAAGRLRFMMLSIKLFSVDGIIDHDMFWIDTPAGILAPVSSGGMFSRTKHALAIMHPWAAWQNILEQLPNAQDIELWHDLAEATATERVNFDSTT